MAMVPQTLYNTNLFVDGINFAGEVPSLSLPKMTIKTDEIAVAGWMSVSKWIRAWKKWRRPSAPRVFVVRLCRSSDWPIRPGSTLCSGVRSRGEGRDHGSDRYPARHAQGSRSGRLEAGDAAEMKFSIAISYYKLEAVGA